MKSLPVLNYKMIRFVSKIILILYVISLTLNSTQSIKAQSYSTKKIFDLNTNLVPGIELLLGTIIGQSLQINNNGDVIFKVLLSDFTKGIALYSENKIRLIVKSVAVQPLNSKVFLSLAESDINDKGDISFCGNLSGKQGLFKYQNDNIIPLAIAGDPVFGIEDSNIEEFSCRILLSSNNSGEIAFTGILSDGRKGLFKFKDNTLESIVLEGDILPLLNTTGPFVIATSPNINDRGDVVFNAAVTNPIKGFIDEGLYLFSDGEIIPVMLRGESAPGLEGRIFNFSWPSALGINKEVLFWGEFIPPSLENPHINIGARVGLFLWSNGNTKPMILHKDPALGGNDIFIGVGSVKGLLGKSAINDFGDIVSFFSTLTNGNGIMLFSDNKAIPVALAEYLPVDRNKIINFVEFANINNKGDIVFLGSGREEPSGKRYEALFLATKEDVPFTVIEIKPDNVPTDSKRRLKVTGAGFQPGATVSFSGKGILILKTEFKTSTNLIATVTVLSAARSGFYDVIVTNPTGERSGAIRVRP